MGCVLCIALQLSVCTEMCLGDLLLQNAGRCVFILPNIHISPAHLAAVPGSQAREPGVGTWCGSLNCGAFHQGRFPNRRSWERGSGLGFSPRGSLLCFYQIILCTNSFRLLSTELSFQYSLDTGFAEAPNLRHAGSGCAESELLPRPEFCCS